MQGVDRSQTSSVRQLCEWFESRGQHQRWDRERPVRMDGSGARIEPAPVEEIRAKFLHNLQMFEQKHVSLAQRSGVVFHGSSPALHETANSTLSCPPGPSLSQTTTASVGKARRKTESYLKDVSRKAPHPGSSQLQTSSLLSGHGSPCVLLTDSSGTTSPVSGNVAAAASDLAKGAIPATRSRNCSQCAQHPTHQPVIRERVKSVAEREEKNSSGHGRKKPLLRVLSSQSGLGSRLRMVGAKKSHFEATSIPQKPSGEKDRIERHSQPCVEHSLSERQDLLQPHSVWYGSGDITNESCPSAHRSRLVSTASIQLKKHSQPVIRKRSSSEERRISVIQTSKCFPETLTKPSPMLDEWLSSLVKQARVQPQEEDVECEDEPLPIRQHAYMSSENSWPYTKKLGSQKRLSGKDSDRNRTSERRDSSGLPSEGCEFSSGTSVCSDPSSSLNAASGEHMLHRRTSKDNVYPKKFERDKSEEKMSPQNSVTGAIGVASRVTEEDEDSACVQSMSDSASVQLCVPISEDPATFPRQHLPLSPCSSLGSYHSAMSSNADSAVDMALPDDETLEVEVSQEGHLDSAVKLKQILFACSLQCSSSSTTTSSSCLTIADSSFALKSSIEPASLSKDVNSILELPSFLISDHSSVECSAEDCESSRPEEDLTDSCQVLEPWGRLPRSPSATSSSSEGSYCSTCWTDSSVSDNETPATKRSERRRKQSSWKKIRSIIRWSPFIQVFKKHRYPWIQLAGHQGNFQAGEAGSVLKKLDSREHQSFQRLMNDRLQPYVPEFRGVVEKNGERYVQLQDLLCEFSSPCVMDIKMGVRTYLEEELTKARKKPTMRKDMYQKMVDVDSNAPTAEEHAQRAVTKPRYMQWRDQMSSSVDLGFRIEGIKKSDGASSKDFKKTKSRDSVADILKAFIGDDEIVLAKYLKRLREISATQESSEFFQSHEVVGSSLLFVHDGRGEVNVWMIDFGKTEPLPKGVVINHRATWVEGNHEDGYLFGLDNIISMLEEMQASSMV